MFRFFSTRRFFVQLVLTFLLFTLIATLGVGIPGAVLLERQTQTQARALLDQAIQTTLALYENEKVELQNLALLVVERPTLNKLLEANEIAALDAYLGEFLSNAGIDAMAVCDGGIVLASAGEITRTNLCADLPVGIITQTNGEGWLLSQAELSEGEGLEVVIGRRVETLLMEFTPQTGLDYVLFADETITASTSNEITEISPHVSSYQMLSLSAGMDETHMAVVLPLQETLHFTWVGIMDLTDTTVLNRQLRQIILGTLLAVSGFGALIAVLLSRRISKPLNQLAQSAAALREGDFSTPTSLSSKVWEIDQLANALEDARIGLKHALDRLRREKIWIENLLDSIVEGLVTVDDRTRITFASAGISHLSEVDADQSLGRPLDDIFHTPAGEAPFSQQVMGSSQRRRIPVLCGKEERLLAVSTSTFIPPEVGNATHALLIRDVSDEERIHRLLGEFMANVTHEFRTPLAALAASVELMEDQLPNLTLEEIEGLLEALNIGIVRLQALIDNLIEAASIEAGRFKVNPHPVELQVILEDTVATIQPLASKHNLTLKIPKHNPAFKVLADRRRTSQVLLNLLSNAIKHSPQGGTVTLRTLLLGDAVMIEVEDEGTGVPADLVGQLFNRFVTPKNDGDFDQLGLGLGLSVVKAVVEAQHGEVGFREAEAGGAAFWITIPLVKDGD